MPKPAVFFTPYIDEIKIINDNRDIIKNEICKEELAPIVPIYGFNKIYSTKYSQLYELLRCIPSITCVGILNINNKFHQSRKYGFNEIANNTIRYFYTIKVSSIYKSGIWIDGEKKFFIEDEWICGDMSREHSLFNKDKINKTIVLFIDIERPSSIHKGNSPNKDINKDEILKLFI